MCQWCPLTSTFWCGVRAPAAQQARRIADRLLQRWRRQRFLRTRELMDVGGHLLAAVEPLVNLPFGCWPQNGIGSRQVRSCPFGPNKAIPTKDTLTLQTLSLLSLRNKNRFRPSQSFQYSFIPRCGFSREASSSSLGSGSIGKSGCCLVRREVSHLFEFWGSPIFPEKP